MQDTLIAVDLSKNVFQVALSRRSGQIAGRKRVARKAFLPLLGSYRRATVLLEACGSAHHWARQIQGLGHRVLLISPHATRPYVQRDKTDEADAKALLEAHRNEEIRPVPVKTLEQQALTGLHRARSAWMACRTARLNLIRGLLREFGVAVPVGARQVLPGLRAVLGEEESPVPRLLHAQLFALAEEVRDLEKRVKDVEAQLRRVAAASPVIRRLQSVPGIGLLTSTALVAQVGDVARFRSGRRFASYLGLTPREYSSGLRRYLGRISKRGDSYLRMLLIHGARAVLLAAGRVKAPDRLRKWALEVKERRGHNRAAVALANKMARIVWAVWCQEREFRSEMG